MPEEPVRGDIKVTFQLNERGWIGGRLSKTMEITVSDGDSITPPRVRRGRFSLRPLRWATAGDELVIRAGREITYDQLLELLGGTTANGSEVVFQSRR